MNDDFLTRYEEELAFFHQSSGLFAQQFPKLAGRLRIDSLAVEDPHVARLIEAFAFLTARTRLKIDDEFPEICEAMLHTLYPHYLAPFPPVLIAQLGLNTPHTFESRQAYRIARGSPMETEAVQGEPCRFQTTQAVELWPLELESIAYRTPPFTVPPFPDAQAVEATVHLRLKNLTAKSPCQGWELSRLRWYCGGEPAAANLLYENLLRDARGVAIGAGGQWHFLPATALRTAGFAADEALALDNQRQLSAFRILSEYFVCPEKFRFVDLQLDDRLRRVGAKDGFEIAIYLGRSHDALARNVTKASLQLHCAPAINTFKLRAEPIRMDQLHAEYQVIPNARQTRTCEVYSIERVIGQGQGGQTVEYQPFYASSHAPNDSNETRYYYASRRPAPPSPGEIDRGTEVFLTFVDLEGQRRADDHWTIDVETICLNRDLAAKLPSADQLNLRLISGGGTVHARCLKSPTPTYRTAGRQQHYWRVISQLSLNHLSLTDEEGIESLREILRLYNPNDSQETRNVIESLRQIRYSRQRAIARVPRPGGGAVIGSGHCRGLDIELWLDQDRLVGAGAYLFASVLEHFFGLYATLNSFTRTTIRLERSEQAFLIGQPRIGLRPLL